MFAGRTQELATLNRLLALPQPSLIVVTGRPRMGKSRLIQEACNHKTVIYLQALAETTRLNFQAFRRACIAVLGDDSGLDTHDDWLGLLNGVAALAAARPGLIVVLDNFSSLADADESLPLVIRTFWQSPLAARSGLKLILCGSNAARMIDLTRGTPTLAQHALADCGAELLDIGPLPLNETAAFLPNYSDEGRIAAHAIFGGVPAYLQLFQPDRPLAANIIDLLLLPSSRLLDEPAQLLAHDLRDVKVYASILRAISNGYRESGDIKAFIMGAQTGMSISPYLEKLRAMRLINDVRSFDADPKARYIRFSISDPLTRFWNLFIQPNRLRIEQGEGREVFETTIKRQLADYMVLGFEDICRDYLRRHAADLFPAPADAVGQMWGAGYNIAVAGRLTDQRPVFGACEWHTRQVGEGGAELLRHQVAAIDATDAVKASDAPAPGYVLFSRSGFTADLLAQAKASPDLRLVTPADIVQS